jgi:hypothetical protein
MRAQVAFRTTAAGLLFGVWFVFSAPTAAAADLRVDPANASGTAIVFEGAIAAGDFERLKNLIVDSGRVREIYLASPGGNLAEAVKIGLLVRHLKLATVVPSKQLTHSDRSATLARHGLKEDKDYICASACFFIFVAGVYRSADDHGPPILGIHGPTLMASAAAKLSPDQANMAIDQARKVIGDYFSAMDVPPKYTEEINSVPKTRMRWIRNDEFQSDFAGFIPELRGVIKAKCGTRFDAVDRSTQKHNDQIYAEERCETELRNELAVRALNDAVKAPNDGRRPSILNIDPQGRPN